MVGDASVTRWNSVAKGLHWIIALAILAEVPAGFAMAWSYGAKDPEGHAWHILMSQIHHTIGLLLIAAVIARIGWRLTHPVPPLPRGTSRAAALLAHAVQAVLYALLLLVPVTGWAALSALAGAAGYPAPEIWFFGHDGFGPGGLIPHIVTPVAYNSPVLFSYGFFAQAHVWLLIGGAFVLTLHVAGALRHHFILKDNVLRRMLPGKDA